MSDVAGGFALAVVAGITTGSFAAPMAHIMKTWDWAHLWVIQTVFGLVVLPWLTAALTTSGMGDAMAEAKGSTYSALIGFGLIWGLGQVTFGISNDLVGVSLTYALVMGTLATMGTLLPMLVYSPENFATVSGAFVLAGVAVIVIGLLVAAKAGQLKERMVTLSSSFRDEKSTLELSSADLSTPDMAEVHRNATAVGDRPGSADAAASGDVESGPGSLPGQRRKQQAKVAWYNTFAFGLCVCIFSGVSAPVLNFGYIEGVELGNLVQARGTSAFASSNTSLAIILSSGSIWNLLFPVYLICRAGSWGKFTASGWPVFWKNFGLCFIMAVLFYSGFSLFGAASILIGDLGPSIGWAVWITVLIIAGNVVGIVNGDWKVAPGKPFRLLVIALLIQTVAVFLSALGVLFREE